LSTWFNRKFHSDDVLSEVIAELMRQKNMAMVERNRIDNQQRIPELDHWDNSDIEFKDINIPSIMEFDPTKVSIPPFEPDHKECSLLLDFDSTGEVIDHSGFQHKCVVHGAATFSPQMEDDGVHRKWPYLELNPDKQQYIEVSNSSQISLKDITSSIYDGFSIVFRFKQRELLFYANNIHNVLFSKFDDNSLLWGYQAYAVEVDNSIHFFARKNGVTYSCYATNVLNVPTEGDYSSIDYDPSDYYTAGATPYFIGDQWLEFRFNKTTNEIKIFRSYLDLDTGDMVEADITIGASPRTMMMPAVISEPPASSITISKFTILNANIVASGTSGDVPAAVNDGNTATWWIHDQYGAWIRMGLGTKKNVQFIKLDLRNSLTTRYYFCIQTSLDGVNFKTHFNGTNAFIDGFQTYYLNTDHSSVKALYVRVLIMANSVVATQNRAQIRELEVWGEVPLSYIKPIETIYVSPDNKPDSDNNYWQNLYAQASTVEAFTEYYTQSSGGSSATLDNLRTRAAIQVLNSDSDLVGEPVYRFRCRLRENGSPDGTSNVYGRVWDSLGNLRYTIDEVDVSDIDETFSEFTFETTGLNSSHNINVGDWIGVEFEDGDEDNYVEVERNSGDPKDDERMGTWDPVDDEWIVSGSGEYDMWIRIYRPNAVLDTGARQRAVNYITNSKSAYMNRQLTYFTATFMKVGAPTGNLLFCIFTSNGTKMFTWTIPLASYSSNVKYVISLTDLTQNYRLQNGDMVGYEYTGGSPTNYVRVKLNAGVNYTGSDYLAFKTYNQESNTYYNFTNKELVGTWKEGGQTYIQSPDENEEIIVDNYLHNLYIGVMGEELDIAETKTLQGFLYGMPMKFHFYRRLVTLAELLNISVNKLTIDDIPYGRVATGKRFYLEE
jgi:hypothetical protein